MPSYRLFPPLILTPSAGIIVETNEDLEIVLVTKYIFVKVKAIGFFFMSLIKYRQSGVIVLLRISLLRRNRTCVACVPTLPHPISTAASTNQPNSSLRAWNQP